MVEFTKPGREKRFRGECYRLEEPIWHNKTSHEILTDHLGIETTPARAAEFESAHDCNPDVIYYLGVAAPEGLGDDTLKLIMGPIAAELNIRKLPMKRIGEVIPAQYLNHFVQAQHDGKFDRNAAR